MSSIDYALKSTRKLDRDISGSLNKFKTPDHCRFRLPNPQTDPDHFYTGFTGNIENRLKDHNSGKDPHTSKFKPQELITYLAFKDRSTALSFEK